MQPTNAVLRHPTGLLADLLVLLLLTQLGLPDAKAREATALAVDDRLARPSSSVQSPTKKDELGESIKGSRLRGWLEIQELVGDLVGSEAVKCGHDAASEVEV